MAFKVGDKVLVLDEDLAGVVKKILGTNVLVETTEGFLLEFDTNELLKMASSKVIKSELSASSINNAIKEKEQSVKRKQPKTKVKERFEPTMEVDLHINQLVKSSKGMTNYDMLTLQLETAKRQLDFAIAKRVQKIVFIHGVGEGVLKVELEYLFGRYSNVKFYDANYQKYGVGATEVYIYQNVPNN
jgi:hypothetical protein